MNGKGGERRDETDLWGQEWQKKREAKRGEEREREGETEKQGVWEGEKETKSGQGPCFKRERGKCTQKVILVTAAEDIA